MGRRSRKRASTPVAPPPAPEAAAPRPAPRAATYKARREEAPQPAWAPVPLTEVCILVSIVLLALGFFVADGERRTVMIVGGMVVGSLAAGELALREHFAGYRSHSSLLAGICAILTAVLLRFLAAPQPVIALAAVIVFALAFFWLRSAFKRRSGGVGFRV